MTMTTISERRKELTCPNDDGDIAYIGIWVDDVQIAAGVRQDDAAAERNGGRRWSLWSSGLRIRLSSDAPVTFEHGGRPPVTAGTLPVRDEHDVRAWLSLLADLAENGPHSVETRLR